VTTVRRPPDKRQGRPEGHQSSNRPNVEMPGTGTITNKDTVHGGTVVSLGVERLRRRGAPWPAYWPDSCRATWAHVVDEDLAGELSLMVLDDIARHGRRGGAA
jgi:hypothetical protein